MSQENVAIVHGAIAAINKRDIDGYLACCTEDVQLITSFAEIGGGLPRQREAGRGWKDALQATGLRE